MRPTMMANLYEQKKIVWNVTDNSSSIKTLLWNRSYFELAHKVVRKLFPMKLVLLGKTNVLVYDGDITQIKRRHKAALFRRGVIDDLPHILECAGDSSHESLYRGYFSAGHTCYLIELDTKVIGYSWAFRGSYLITFDGYKTSRIRSILGAKTAFLGDGYVRPEYRLAGFFPQLVSGIMEDLKGREGTSEFLAHVYYSNPHSLKSHLRMGFRCVNVVYYASILGVRVVIMKNKNSKYRVIGYIDKNGICLRSENLTGK